ncbi:LLM class flavin-dependent oxidoreductase [Rhodococcus triatomae]|uniref:Probable oxidoreductase, LLM family n=1 Tax=Rhodococcus triatomae TaxID=300028 RepID=A0A1G8SSN0_9NOCA|nr:LLM class flavin-dependent oxidoreductase [Rhodococcus triatomae]QNG20815.1 LLM class flavin-dependent oxidoreductase [Rhodococcus triatomae]QNG23270.1 LLM class flavin-dependent oxidoreductase [Rhodococcus triatomae]SDJ31580.1 probable oxidoreductase, LLM family [Rhodococcus triatomae]
MELGLTTFAEIAPGTARDGVSPARRLRDLLEEVELAEQVGLDVYGVGEHHRADYVASAPAVVLSAAAARTSRIALTSAVTVLSSDDPVRVFEEFATVDLISGGRAEVMAGRGSFTESFPLFGYDLADYDELFAEKLDLLLALRDSEVVTWEGRHRPALAGQSVYPDPGRKLPVWVAVGGNPHSVVRAGALGLPMALAIIGGQPARFAPLADLHRRAIAEAGHEPQPLAVHAHGFVGATEEEAVEQFYPSYAQAMTALGRERGWTPMSRGAFDQLRGPEGSLVLGNPEQVAEKIVGMRDGLGLDRFMLHPSVGPLPHADVMRAIELFGTEVAPLVHGN